MVLLTQRKQLGLEVEAAEGTPETITASELVTVLNPAANINLNNIRRPVLRGSFSKVTSGTGIQDGGVTFDQEFSGPADGLVTTSSPLGVPLRACGFREVTLFAIQVTSMTGMRAVVGDEMVASVGGTGGSQARIRLLATFTKDALDLGDTHGDILFYERLTAGNIVSTDTQLDCDNTTLDTVTESHSGTTPVLTFATQTGTRVGTAWVPSSQQTKRLTISVPSGTFTVGETIAQSQDAGLNDYAYGRIVATDSSTYIDYVSYTGTGFEFGVTGAPISKVAGNSSGETADVDALPIPLETPSITAKMFEDGITKIFAGCRGSCTFTFPTGEFPLANFNLQGAYNAVADEANLDAGGASQGPVPTFLGVDFRVDRTWLPCTANIGIDIGQNLVRRTCAGNASGLEGFVITDRVPTMTMDPEAVQEIVGEAYTDAKAATAFPLSLRFGNFSSGTGTDAWLISADQVQYEELNAGDRDGIITHEGTLQVNGYPTLNDAELAICNYSYFAVNSL